MSHISRIPIDRGFLAISESFCTNEGSGMGSSVRFIKKLCPNAIVDDGISIGGFISQQADYQPFDIVGKIVLR